jgi:tetratricopeptide (TPR) repeat protein
MRERKSHHSGILAMRQLPYTEQNLLFHEKMHELYNTFRFVEIMRTCRSKLRGDAENPFLWYWLSLSADALRKENLARSCAEKAYYFIYKVPVDLKTEFLMWILRMVNSSNEVMLKGIMKEASENGASIPLCTCLLLKEAKTHQALKLLQKAPLTPETIYWKARCHHSMFEIRGAIEELEKGITLFPSSYMLRSRLAYLFISEKYFDDALSIIEELIDFDRCEPRLLKLGIEICLLKGNWFRFVMLLLVLWGICPPIVYSRIGCRCFRWLSRFIQRFRTRT